ncbi:MAG: hypothetical protein CL677_02340, partial [Bdellovibrionaceae bacterium]|nr:hypothetical protein [Pseudobdellovibrionaceae bacterium]
NHSRRKIIYFNGSLTSKGPYLHSFSPNQSQLVIYSGVLNGKGEFEIFDKEGRSLFKDNYLGEIKWNPLNQLEYSSATKIVIEKDHPMYEKCLQVGAAYRLDYFRVLGRTKLKGDKPSQIACAKR